jgi:hypothetical protein
MLGEWVAGTIDLGGQMRFGPDVEWVDAGPKRTLADCDLDYDVNPSRAESFYAEVRKYWCVSRVSPAAINVNERFWLVHLVV